MESLTQNQKLDVVLNFLKDNPTKIFDNDLIVKMKEKGLIKSQYDLKPILVKLEKDENILTIKELGQYEAFIITPKGQDFVGYVNEKAYSVSESIRLEKLEFDQMESQKSMARLTFWIAIGTVTAAVIGVAILFLQWYAYLHPIFPSK